MIRSFAALCVWLATTAVAAAQTYPSPTLQDVTILGSCHGPGCTTGQSGISGLTTGQLGIASSPTTLGSSIPFGLTGNNTLLATNSSGLIANSVILGLPSSAMSSTVSPGSCTACNITFDLAGRITAASNGSGGSAWTITDGTHSVAGVTNLNVTGGTVGGTSPNATLTISGGGGSGTVGTGSANQIAAYPSTGTTVGGYAVGGDATAAISGSNLNLTVTKTNGTSFAPSATTDTTNAGNISSGTLSAARLPLATTGAFGAVKPDGSTITISGGVISAPGSGGGTVNSGTATHLPYYASTGTAVSNDPYLLENGGATPGTLEYNQNATAFSPFGTTANAVHVTAKDTLNGEFQADAFSTHYAAFRGRNAGGTGASKTATGAGQILSAFSGGGYDTTNGYDSAQGEFDVSSFNAWTASDHSTALDWYVTPSGATAEVRAMHLENNGGLTLPYNVTGGSQGAGTINVSGGYYVNGSPITGGTSNNFVGITTGSANTQALAAPGYTLSNGNSVMVQIGPSLTNTGPTTLTVGSTGALAVAAQSDGGLSPLVGGELQAGLQYDLSYQAGCPSPISANCYVIKTTIASGVTNTAISPSAVTPALWKDGHFYSISASGQTITLPASTTLSPIGGLLINAIGSVTIQSTSPDVLCTAPGSCGSAGGSAVINAGTHTAITSDGAGHIYVPLGANGSISGLTTNTIPKATSSSGIGNSSVTDDGTYVVIGDQLKNFQAYTQMVSIIGSTFAYSATAGVNVGITLVHASCPCTIPNPTNLASAIGQTGMLDITQSSTGSDTIGTWGSDFITPGGTSTLTLSTAANAVDHIAYRVIDSTHVLLGPVLQNATH